MTDGMHDVPHIYSSSLLFSSNSYTKAECDPGQKNQILLLVQTAEAGGRLKLKVPESQLSGPETISRAFESGQNLDCMSKVSSYH